VQACEKDYSGRTPIQVAEECGHDALARMLSEQIGPPNARGRDDAASEELGIDLHYLYVDDGVQ